MTNDDKFLHHMAAHNAQTPSYSVTEVIQNKMPYECFQLPLPLYPSYFVNQKMQSLKLTISHSL